MKAGVGEGFSLGEAGREGRSLGEGGKFGEGCFSRRQFRILSTYENSESSTVSQEGRGCSLARSRGRQEIARSRTRTGA